MHWQSLRRQPGTQCTGGTQTPMRLLLISLTALLPAAAMAQAPCTPSDLSTRCALERTQKSAEEYRANMQKNLEDLQRQRAEQEERERRRKADCLARLDKLNKNEAAKYTSEQLCGF